MDISGIYAVLAGVDRHTGKMQKTDVGTCRHTGVIRFQISDLFLKVRVNLSGSSFVAAAGREQSIKPLLLIALVPAFDGCRCRMDEGPIWVECATCRGRTKVSLLGLVLIWETDNQW